VNSDFLPLFRHSWPRQWWPGYNNRWTPASIDNHHGVTQMKAIILAAALSLAATNAFATCKSDAADKKLAGAALTSFMKKCQSDASTKCETDSKSMKLAGAAKTSHMKKCVADAVGN
jgi:hypothetical protein